MKSRIEVTSTVSELVRSDYRRADVFKKFGINYCCGGEVPLEEACKLKGLDVEEVSEALAAATRDIQVPSNLDLSAWKMSFLIDYIVNLHHAFLNTTLPGLEALTLSFVSGHAKKNPELAPLPEALSELSNLLIKHNRHEEDVIFPYIRQLEHAYLNAESYGPLFVRTLRKPLEGIEIEHDAIERLLAKLRAVTNHYRFPDNACTNHRVIFNKLAALDRDLIQHKHLEATYLFPKAKEMEGYLLHPMKD